MKHFVLSIATLMLAITGTFAQKSSKDVAKFVSESIDLGKIKQDNPTTATFEITNIGTEPLLIEQASPTCGCTIGEYTKEPIAPGKMGTIKATYNAKNIGLFEKRLNVKFAGYDMQFITIKGEVIPNPDAPKAPAPTLETAPKTEAVTAPVVEEKAKVIAQPAVKKSPAKKPATKKP
jgi:hypothetical protein